MFEQVWKEEYPDEPSKVSYEWTWNRADTGMPEHMVPFESINHQRKIEDAFQNGYDLAEILVEKKEIVNGKEKNVKVAYTIRLDKKTQSYQQHRTGDS
jgi:hypothetical protein